jgi:hypothetical protein
VARLMTRLLDLIFKTTSIFFTERISFNESVGAALRPTDSSPNNRRSNCQDLSNNLTADLSKLTN